MSARNGVPPGIEIPLIATGAMIVVLATAAVAAAVTAVVAPADQDDECPHPPGQHASNMRLLRDANADARGEVDRWRRVRVSLGDEFAQSAEYVLVYGRR
ncbi:MAG: hypothetical protein ACYC28_15495 [Longimicrobiales bacterium]